MSELVLWDGDAGRTLLRVEDDDTLALEIEGVRLVLPEGAVEAVMEKFGGPLAEDVAPSGTGLPLGEGASLHALRHLARYDVIGRDYLVLVRPGRDSLVQLATSVAAALRHLAEAAARA